MNIPLQENISLKSYNSFGIAVKAKKFVSVTTEDALQKVVNSCDNKPYFILGGGSNILLTKDINCLVIHINLKGITVVKKTETHVFLKAMAGENWHQFVMYCISNNYGGVENLSLIPGNVGTSPIQNIGAYGVELKETFVSCEVWDTIEKKSCVLTKEECDFGYRNSIFKTSQKGRYIILSVTFQLTTKQHKLQTNYGAIEEQLKQQGAMEPTIKDVSKAVIAIRSSKLPDPKELGNSGSFFKNPVIDSPSFTAFIKKHPEAPFYKVSDTSYKIPAGWLIEQAGFKGKRFGDAGVHKQQALVLVNYGNASGEEIWALAKNIQEEVAKQFDISLEAEVNIF